MKRFVQNKFLKHRIYFVRAVTSNDIKHDIES